MPLRRVTGDDVDFAVRDALDEGSPDATIARLLAAVGDPALRGVDFSAAQAMVAVSELQVTYGRVAEAEATLRRAVAEDLRDEVVEPRAYLAALLVATDRPEEAAREFATLSDLDRAGAREHQIYGEALESAGDRAGAVRVYETGASLDHALAGQLRKAAARAGSGPVGPVRPSSGEVPSVLFWPRADHTRAVATWPTLKDDLGADWDDHRAMVERALSRAESPTYARADYDTFAARTRGLVPIGTTLSAYLRACGVSGTWPPPLGAACWCGSGQRYKRCCRPRGLAHS